MLLKAARLHLFDQEYSKTVILWIIVENCWVLVLNIFVETVAIFFKLIILLGKDALHWSNFTENYFYSSKNPVIKNYIIVFTKY